MAVAGIHVQAVAPAVKLGPLASPAGCLQAINLSYPKMLLQNEGPKIQTLFGYVISV